MPWLWCAAELSFSKLFKPLDKTKNGEIISVIRPAPELSSGTQTLPRLI